MDDGEMTRALFLQLLRTRMSLRRALQRTLKKHGMDISFEMLQVINRLYDNPGLSQQELAEVMSKSKASVSNVLANLEKRSYLRREEDPRDRRNKKVYLTEEGIMFHYRLAPMVQEVYAYAEERMGKGMTQTTRKALEDLYDILETY